MSDNTYENFRRVCWNGKIQFLRKFENFRPNALSEKIEAYDLEKYFFYYLKSKTKYLPTENTLDTKKNIACIILE